MTTDINSKEWRYSDSFKRALSQTASAVRDAHRYLPQATTSALTAIKPNTKRWIIICSCRKGTSVPVKRTHVAFVPDRYVAKQVI